MNYSLSGRITSRLVHVMFCFLFFLCIPYLSWGQGHQLRIDEILDEEISESLEKYDLNHDGILDNTEIELGFTEIKEALEKYAKQQAEDLGEVPPAGHEQSWSPYGPVLVSALVGALTLTLLILRCRRRKQEQAMARNASLLDHRDKWLEKLSREKPLPEKQPSSPAAGGQCRGKLSSMNNLPSEDLSSPLPKKSKRDEGNQDAESEGSSSSLGGESPDRSPGLDDGQGAQATRDSRDRGGGAEGRNRSNSRDSSSSDTESATEPGSSAGARQSVEDSPWKSLQGTTASIQHLHVGSKSEDSAKLQEFLSSVCGCKVIVDRKARKSQYLCQELRVVPWEFPSTVESVSTLLGPLLQLRHLRLIGPEQVKVLVRLVSEVQAGSADHTDRLVERASQLLPALAYSQLTATVIQGAAPVDEDDDDLWSDYKNLKGALNERAEAMLKCLSGYYTGEGYAEMTGDMVVELYSTCDSASSASLLQQLLMEASRSLWRLERFDDLFCEPDLVALDKLFCRAECAGPLASLLLGEVSQAKFQVGSYFQTTGLGQLLSLTTLPQLDQRKRRVEMVAGVTAVFESIPGWPDSSHGAINDKMAAMRNGLGRIQHLVFMGLKQVLCCKERKRKEAGLAWLATVINLNDIRATTAEPANLGNDVTCGDGYMVNLCAVLLEFFEPIFQPAKLAKVDLSYCLSPACRIHYDFETCLAGSQIVAEGGREFGMLPEELWEKYNFITECYHLCQRVISVSILPCLRLLDRISSDAEKEMAGIEDETLKQKAHARSQLILHMYQTAAWEGRLVRRVTVFYLAQAQLLLRLLHPTEGGQGELALQRQRAAFAQIPEFAIKDMASWFMRLTLAMPSLEPSLFTGLSFVPFVDLSVGLLERQDLMPGPIAASKIVRTLLYFVKESSRSNSVGWGSGQVSELATVVLACPSVQSLLCPALLHTYVSVDVVEGLDVDKDSFDKYQARLDISELIQCLWDRHDCRASVLEQCHSDQFTHFLDAILDTLLYMLHDSLSRLANVKKLEDEKENQAEWDQLTTGEQRQKEKFLSNEEFVAKGFMSSAKKTLKFLHLMTCEDVIAACFTQPPLSKRAASAICGFLDSLCGSKSKNFKVKNMEKYKFNPSELLLHLAEVIMQIAGQDSAQQDGFVRSMAANPDFEPGHLHRAQSVFSAKGLMTEDKLGEFGTLNVVLDSLQEELQTENDEESMEMEQDWRPTYLNLSIDEAALLSVYQEQLSDARFRSASLQPSHSYRANFQEMGARSAKVKVLMREMKQLQQNLPICPSASIFVVQDSERFDVMRCMMSGPEGTPYSRGLFAFDVYFPSSYPNSPPLVKIITTGQGTVRFNPNLYPDGKVCLSLLGTWHAGDASEKWIPGKSSLYQVLISIQSMILTPDPVFNEPGYEGLRGTEDGERQSREYNWKIHKNTIRYAMLGQLRNPPPGLEDVVRLHFALQRQAVLRQCAQWLADCQDPDLAKRLRQDSDALHQQLLALDPATLSLQPAPDCDQSDSDSE